MAIYHNKKGGSSTFEARPKSKDHCQGFTLLEIMVVALLIALIAGIVVPRFESVFETQLKSAMRKIAGSIKFCFNEAVIKQSTIRLKFDLSQGTYNYSVLVTDPDSKIGQFIEMPSDIAEPAILPGGVFFTDIVTPRSLMKVEDGETFILFYPTGYAEKAVIHLGDRYGRKYTMLVKPLNGGVKIFEGYIDFMEFNNTETPFGTASSPVGN